MSADIAPNYEKLLAAMAASIENPVMILSEDREILYENQIMREIFGNLVGQKAGILFINGVNGEEADYNESVGGNRRRAGAIETKIADVDYKLIETEIALDGNNYLAVMLEDISEKKNVESQVNAQIRRHNTDTAMAGLIQKSVLPKDGNYWNIIQFESVYLPAEELSGDAYDIIKLNDDEILLYIADVSGHGIQASLLTMFINEKVRSNAATATDGLDILLAKILRGFIALGIDARVYMTLLCCVYNRKKRELAIANAGHNCYPLIVRKNGRTEEIPVRGMPISRISEEDTYEEEIIEMASGDKLLLYTDGLIEEYSRKTKSVFGSEGVRRVAEENALLPGGELAGRIIAEAAKFTMVDAKDDRTLLVAEIL